MYLGFILWAIVLVVILWNISPALVITSVLIGIAMAIGKTKDNPPREYKKYFTDGMLIVDYIDIYKKFKV